MPNETRMPGSLSKGILVLVIAALVIPAMAAASGGEAGTAPPSQEPPQHTPAGGAEPEREVSGIENGRPTPTPVPNTGGNEEGARKLGEILARVQRLLLTSVRGALASGQLLLRSSADFISEKWLAFEEPLRAVEQRLLELQDSYRFGSANANLSRQLDAIRLEALVSSAIGRKLSAGGSARLKDLTNTASRSLLQGMRGARGMLRELQLILTNRGRARR